MGKDLGVFVVLLTILLCCSLGTAQPTPTPSPSPTSQHPVLKPMPDVCIADDDGTGYNFQYAFNLDSYVEELPPGKTLDDVIWTYEDFIASPSWMLINGVGKMPDRSYVCDPAYDVRITAPGEQSFQLSGPLPWATEVIYFACVDGAASSETISVSTDCTTDELSIWSGLEWRQFESNRSGRGPGLFPREP